jgi:lysozyme family protein
MDVDSLLWATARDLLLELEGGYVNDPRDPGGETNFGICRKSHPNEDIEGMTRERAASIYHGEYWSRIPAHYPAGVRWFAFDCAVHHGVSRAFAWLAPPERSLARHATVESMAAARLAFMTGLTTWPVYARGWARRVAAVLAGITAWEFEHGRENDPGTLVLHDLTWRDRVACFVREPVVLRGEFVARERDRKVDVRRA